MTKDTKVGLVIGLAFIVGVVALLKWVSNPSRDERQANHYRDSEDYRSDSGLDKPLFPLKAADRIYPDKDDSPPKAEDLLGSKEVQEVFTFEKKEEPIPVPVVKRAPEPKYHEVKVGETLWDIAVAEYGPSKGHKWKVIFEANKHKFPDAYRISVGTKLLIPQLTSPPPGPDVVSVLDLNRSQIYVVRVGDTLSEISLRKLGTSRRWREIQRLNGLDSDTGLRVGMKLKLPAVTP